MDNMGLHFSNLTKNSRLGMYIPVPVCLLTTPLSSTTLLIYGSLLNRAMLSQKNDWVDESGEIFVCFSIKEIASYVGRGISTVKAALKELEGVVLDDLGAGRKAGAEKKYEKLRSIVTKGDRP